MKIAIHQRKGSFSDRWIDYCKINSIEYKIVNAYDSDIIKQIEGCDAFMWHFHHADYRDNLFAKQLLFSLQQSGIKVFPDFASAWHFDDKVGEKYLLESLSLPLVPSYVFYDKNTAKKWLETVSYPIVFKLRGGAGSSNVLLLKNYSEANTIIQKAFSNGFRTINSWKSFKECFMQFRKGKKRIKDVLYKAQFLFYTPLKYKMLQDHKGYVLFQKFIPNNNYDMRVIVIGDKAFAIKRMVRENDFRASGSGLIVYDKSEMDESCVKIAFTANEKIGSQCIGFDFVFDERHTPLVVEISFGFSMHGYDDCPGYWTRDMCWHEGKFNPQDWQIENLIKDIIE